MSSPRIGLEIHIQLATASKCFCPCPVEYSAPPNTTVCPVCMGYPGALPVLNKAVVEHGVLLGMALGCEVHEESRFDRKNYFYPDLPKGYQITQQDFPLCTGGMLEYGPYDTPKQVRLTRIHIEEDAAKMIHDREDVTLLDYNRCGVPLLELVTEPDITSGIDAADCVAELQRLVRWLEISEAEMSLGQLRCDVNISVTGSDARTEVKNLNSLRSIREAVDYEYNRQHTIIESGSTIESETLLWDEEQHITLPMRGKESTAGYRYMPDPDLLPLRIPDVVLAARRATMEEPPRALQGRLLEEYAVPAAQAEILTSDYGLSQYFLSCVEALAASDTATAATWITGEVLHTLHERGTGIRDFPIRPERLAELLNRIASGAISTTAAKQVFEAMLDSSDHPDVLIEKLGLAQISDESQLMALVRDAVKENPDAVEQFRKGKDRAAGFIVGQVMKATGGKANPTMVRKLVEEVLGGMQ